MLVVGRYLVVPLPAHRHAVVQVGHTLHVPVLLHAGLGILNTSQVIITPVLVAEPLVVEAGAASSQVIVALEAVRAEAVVVPSVETAVNRLTFHRTNFLEFGGLILYIEGLVVVNIKGIVLQLLIIQVGLRVPDVGQRLLTLIMHARTDRRRDMVALPLNSARHLPKGANLPSCTARRLACSLPGNYVGVGLVVLEELALLELGLINRDFSGELLGAAGVDLGQAAVL
mmetsp:Transcript_4448/g.6577  ORF Transcript_4448/g.6577 Transcript_4448/m.6577 type:complete len:228 (-) Transcript_4448:480-1163(-)